jgi:hypothetical protein
MKQISVYRLTILMMNSPDEAMRLTACDLAGGIVSLTCGRHLPREC